MPNLDLDSIARDIYNASYIDLAKEKQASDEKNKKDTYSIESLNAFIEQFHTEFNNMYAKTLENLHISPTRNPTLSGIVKDSLLNVLAEESGKSIINPETHKLDFSNFSRESLKKARHRVKQSQSPKELDNAANEPETSSSSSSSSNTSKTIDETQDKSNLSFDKLLDHYSSLSTSKEKLDFIQENMIYDADNLADDQKEILTKQIALYMDYKEFVKGIREVNPDISREDLRNMYLEEHSELDKEEFYDMVDFTKAYLKLQEIKADIELYEKNPELAKQLQWDDTIKALQTKMNSLLDDIKPFMEKYPLSKEIIEKLCENLNDEELFYTELEAIDNNDEELSYSELAKEPGEFIYGDFEDESEINTFLKTTSEFANAYSTLEELQDDYEFNESPELAEKIEHYSILVNDYIDKHNLSEEEIVTLIKSNLYSEKDDDVLPGLEEKEIEEELDLNQLDFEELEDYNGSNPFELDSELDTDISYNLEDETIEELDFDEIEQFQNETLDIESLNTLSIENETEQNITEYAYEQNDSKPPIFQAFDDTKGSGKVFETVTKNLENVNKEHSDSTFEISENPIMKFFKDRIAKLTQKSLSAGQINKTQSENISSEQNLNLNTTTVQKQSIFSRMKNVLSTLVNVNQSKESAVETLQNDTIQDTQNSWTLSEEERFNFQKNAEQLSKNIQNHQNKPNKKTSIEVDKDNVLNFE